MGLSYCCESAQQSAPATEEGLEKAMGLNSRDCAFEVDAGCHLASIAPKAIPLEVPVIQT